MVYKVLLMGLLLCFIVIIMIGINNTNKYLKRSKVKYTIFSLSSNIFFIYLIGIIIILSLLISNLDVSSFQVQVEGIIAMLLSILAYTKMGILWITDEGVIFKGELIKFEQMIDVSYEKNKLSLTLLKEIKKFYLIGKVTDQFTDVMLKQSRD